MRSVLVFVALFVLAVGASERPGETMAKEGVTAKHPVVILPGIMSSQLMIWKLKCDSSKDHFRETVWVNPKLALLSKKCFTLAVTLNEDGLDPEGAVIRAKPGIDGAEYIGPSSLIVDWVYKYIVRNLADVGYTDKNLAIMTYDWRLSLANLEKRDSFFTVLMSQIQTLRAANGGEKVVIPCHSLGSVVGFAFMQWAENKQAGWVAENVHAFIPIAGPLLGAPKAVRAVSSADMSEFAAIPRNLYSHADLHAIAVSWSSFATLWPKGGETIWGSDPNAFVDSRPIGKAKEAYLNETLNSFKAPTFHKFLDEVSMDMTPDKDTPLPPAQTLGDWSNPLVSPLPNAPDMTIYLLYGVGVETETAYDLKTNPADGVLELDTKRNSDGFKKGVLYTDGDGSANLISEGYMGLCGWKDPRLNPSSMPVVVREYKHKRSFDGSTSAQHWRILGNKELITDLLHIATGNGEKVEARLESDIEALVEQTGRCPKEQKAAKTWGLRGEVPPSASTLI